MIKEIKGKQLILPDFIIVGMMKSGTSSLSFHLRNHPRISMPEVAEIFFFSKEHNYSQGLEWYSDKLSAELKDKTLLIGEKTPNYAYLPYVAERIHKVLPDVKLIWIFRNPVDRTYSNYLHGRKLGLEPLRFNAALNKESKGLRTDPFGCYVNRSFYDVQLKRFLDYFPIEQMHFTIFEDFTVNPKNEIERILDFLGLTTEGYEFRDEILNKTLLPRFPTTLWLTRKIFGKGGIAWNTVNYLNLIGKKQGYKKLDALTRAELAKVLKPHKEELESIIGQKITSWDKDFL